MIALELVSLGVVTVTDTNSSRAAGGATAQILVPERRWRTVKLVATLEPNLTAVTPVKHAP